VAYRADIEIAVRGAQELKRLGDQINATSKLVDGLNNYLENIGTGGVVRNINNLQQVVSDAAAALNEAALGTKEATLAAQNYVTATANLNNGLREKLQLLKQVNEAERQQRLSSAGIRETTQFAGPIGPGPASPVGSLVGQKSPVEERLGRIIAAREDELQLQRALLALEEKSAAAANKELQARGEIARLTAQGVNAASFRATQAGTQLALPAFQERGLKLLDDSVKLNESNRRIEQALNGERARGVRFLEKQTAEERRQIELGILGTRTGQLSGTARARGAVPTGGFPVAGPLESPGFRKTQQSVGRFGENIALGAGFPLLFGGGAGSIAGSVLGSFVGTGFGGQILGGAIGQALDQAIQKTAQLGTALQTLNISALEESGIRINANLETQIILLRQVGDLNSAQLALQQQVFNVTGAIPGTVEGISDAVNLLGSSWGEFTASVGVTLGILSAPFAAALAGILNILNNALRGLNLILSALGTGIKLAGEWAIRLLAGEQVLQSIQEILKQNNSELERARAQYIPILASLNGEVLLTRALLNLEKQKTLENKSRNAYLTYQQSVLRINADIDQQIREEQAKQTEATKTLVAEKVRLLNVTRAQKTEEAQFTLALEQQRIRQEEAAKRAREAQQAEKQRVQNAVTALNLQSQILSIFVDQTQAQINTETFLKGELGGIEAFLKVQDKITEAKTIALYKDKQAALLTATNAEEQQYINDLFARRIDLLQRQTNLEKLQAERRKNQLYFERFGLTEGISNAAKLAREAAFGNAPGTAGGAGAFRTDINLMPGLTNGVVGEQFALLKTELEELVKVENQVIEAAKSIGDAFGTSLKGVISGTMTAQEALANFFQSVADHFADMAAQMISKWIQMQILGLAQSLLPGGSTIFPRGVDNFSSFFGAGGPSFSVGAFGGARAAGGPVASGSTYMVGERGPELFVPRSSGTIVPNHALSGTTNVVVNVDASGSTVQGDSPNANQLGRVISAAVQAELVKQQRPGGLLAGTR